MEIETIDKEATLDALGDEWTRLHASAGRSPFTHPAIFTAWWHNYGRGGGGRLHIIAGHFRGRLVALAPLVVVRRYGVRFLEWAGTNILDYNEALFDGQVDRRSFWQTIQTSQAYDVAFIRGIDRDSHSYAPLAGIGKPVRRRSVCRIQLDWASADAWMAEALSRSRRQQLRRKQRLLQKSGRLVLGVHRSGAVPQEVLNALVRQKSEWARREGRPGLFDAPAKAEAFLKQLAEAAAAAGNLHLSWLACDEAIIATHLGFVHHDTFYYYQPSFDLNWSEYSPGNVLLAKVIGWCIDNGIPTLDFMMGDHGYKNAYANQKLELTDFLFPASLTGRFADWALRNLYFRSRDRPHEPGEHEVGERLEATGH